MRNILTFLLVLFCSSTVLGADLSVLDKILEAIPGEGATLTGLAVVVEMVMRFTKTEKPSSMVYLISGGIKLIGQIMEKLGAMLDAILPQKTK